MEEGENDKEKTIRKNDIMQMISMSNYVYKFTSLQVEMMRCLVTF